MKKSFLNFDTLYAPSALRDAKARKTSRLICLYCGLNDADAGNRVLSVAEAQEDARKIITDKGLDYIGLSDSVWIFL